MKYLISYFRSFLIFFIYMFDYIFALNIEELKSLNYEVDISQIPVKNGEEQILPIIHMTSIYGQDYQCMLPQFEDEETSEKETVNEKSTDVKELLKPMKSASCLLKGKDWWTYEFCFGHYIKQFHIEDGQIIGQVITLGLYESDYDWNNETDQEKFKHVKQLYHSQYYVNGTKCDLTGQPRTAEVRLYCEEDAGDYIHRVDEPGTCSYIITIHTSRLCSHPQLKPIPSKKAHTILCHPLLNEEQYSIYLQKFNEEKELADQKRSQWLNNQQERLKVMKDVNLQKTETGFEKLIKMTDSAYTKDKSKETGPISVSSKNMDKSKDKSSDSVENDKSDEANGAMETFPLLKEYEREIERLKLVVPPEKFGSIKKSIIKHFSMVLSETEEELNPLSNAASHLKLVSTLDALSRKLDKAEKDVIEASKQLNKARSAVSEKDVEVSKQNNAKLVVSEKDVGQGSKQLNAKSVVSEKDAVDISKDPNEAKSAVPGATSDDFDDVYIENEDSRNGINEKKDSLIIEGTEKTYEINRRQVSVLDDDELHVRIRRLDRKAGDANLQLYEMDNTQKKKLEQAVKEKLEKAVLDTGGRRIEVKIITAGYYDNAEGKDFNNLSDEETNQFQNMILALLTGQQEALQEIERHKKLEESYKFTWEPDDKDD